MPETVEADSANHAVPDRSNAVGDLAMGLFSNYTGVLFGNLGDMMTYSCEPVACLPF